jgi:hypothetical protein
MHSSAYACHERVLLGAAFTIQPRKAQTSLVLQSRLCPGTCRRAISVSSTTCLADIAGKDNGFQYAAQAGPAGVAAGELRAVILNAARGGLW